jgi:WD40 repeat protein/serine/threonine protein kinase
MNDNSSSTADSFGPIADEFVEAFRQGKRPSVEEFVRRYPGHAEEIREMLPALVLMEKAKSAHDSPGEAETSAGPAAVAPLHQLGDYHILREVGRGGMGVVYEAEQVSLGRHVALKVLPAHALLDPRQLGRFQREARSAARLHHTNIVPVFGVGEHEGLHYYVMQFIAGLGLDEVLAELKRLRWPKEVACLTAAHRAAHTKDVSAAQIAQGLLTGAFRVESADAPVVLGSLAAVSPHSPLSPLGSREGEGGELARVPRSESALHLPGQTEATSLTSSGRQYWQSVARVGVQVAQALEYAWQQGVLHRDIKPSNLLLDGQGNVWVTDFGLAKGETDGDNLTHTGDIVGTLRYMAPERFNGKGDIRSDLYSLGLTLYELLTLRPAFDEPDRNKLVKQVMHDEPARPRNLSPAVPRDLETVVLKAIAREPAQRYQSPAEMAEDLTRFVEDRPVKARRVSETEKFLRWCRRNPLPASLLAGIVLVFLAGFAGVFWQWRAAEAARKDEEDQRNRAEALRTAAEDARELAFAGEAKAKTQKERAESTLYFSNIARAQLEYRANNVADAEAILDRCPVERRGWEWHYLKGLNHADLLTLTGHSEGWVDAVASSPDGKRIASAGGGNPYWRAQGPGSIKPGEVILWNASTGERLHTLGGFKHLVHGIAFSPDGKRLASASVDGKVRVWDVAAGKELYRKDVSGAYCVAYSPNGELLAAGEGDGGIVVWEAASGKERFTCRASQLGVVSLAFTPDSRRLAAISGSHFQAEVRIWDLAAGPKAVPLYAPGAGYLNLNALAISPDGRYLAAGDSPSLIKLWELSSGRLVRTLTGHLSYVRGLAFSPDGLFLASASEDSTIRVWSTETGNETLIYRGHIGQVHGLAFNPDGTRLVSGGIDGTVRIWDVTLHPELASLHAHQLMDFNHEVEALGFGPTKQALTLARMGRAVGTFHPTDHTLLNCFALDLTTKWLTPAEPACLDAEGRWLAGVSQEGLTVVKCWDARTGKERVVLRGHRLPVWQVTVSPGGRRIATGTTWRAHPDQAGEVKVWDGATGRPLFELTEKGLGVTRLALSPDGNRLALAGVRAVAGPGGKEPVMTAFIAVLAIPGGQQLREVRGSDGVWWGLAFSGDGRRLAAAGNYRRVLLWDLDADKPTVIRHGPDTGQDVTFSPDGRRLAVAGRPMVKLLDARTGEEILVLRGEAHVKGGTGGYNPRVRWSPDGRLLAATCGGSVSVWSAAGDALAERAVRSRAADRRAVVHHLTLAKREAGTPDFSTRFHLDRLRGAQLGSPWDSAQRGLAFLQAGEAERAEADYARSANQGQPSALVCFQFGAGLATAGRWKQAAPYFERYFRLGVGQVDWSWFVVVPLPLYLDDPPTYRRYCRHLLERYRRSEDPSAVANVLQWGLLVGDAGLDPQALVRLADRCLIGNEKHSDYRWMVTAKGMAEYRAGRMAQAVEWLRKADALVWEQERKPAVDFFLAMAYQRLDQAEKAKAAYQQGLRIVETEFGSLDRYQPGKGWWYAWPYCQVLRREAEAVLNGRKPAKKPKD